MPQSGSESSIIAISSASIVGLLFWGLRKRKQASKQRKGKEFRRIPLSELPELKNDTLIRAAFGKETEYTPVRKVFV